MNERKRIGRGAGSSNSSALRKSEIRNRWMSSVLQLEWILSWVFVSLQWKKDFICSHSEVRSKAFLFQVTELIFLSFSSGSPVPGEWILLSWVLSWAANSFYHCKGERREGKSQEWKQERSSTRRGSWVSSSTVRWLSEAVKPTGEDPESLSCLPDFILLSFLYSTVNWRSGS